VIPKGSLLNVICPVGSPLKDSGRSTRAVLKALTVTGATVDETVAFVIGGIGLVEVDDFDMAVVDSEGVLEDLWDWDCASEIPVKDEELGDCIRDDGLDSCIVELDTPLISLVRFEVEALNVGVAAFGLFIDAEPSLRVSSLLCGTAVLSFPPPTAPLMRLYNPLSPFWINSSVIPLGSSSVEVVGGEANSLNVVRVSDREAVLCIASRA
jgi:hypothetical protein